jgi:AraC-like DNA-binding protein
VPDDGSHLIDVVEFETSHPDATYEYVSKAYVGYRLRLSVPLRNYRFRARSCVGGPFRYDITDHVIRAAEALTEPFAEPTFGTLLRGHLRIQAGGLGEAALRPGDSFVYPSGRTMLAQFENCEIATVQLPRERAAAIAAARSDLAPADLRFDSVSPISPGTARYWASLVAYLGRQLITPDEQAPLRRSALLQSAALDMLAAAALTVFPNTAMTAAQLPGPGRVAPPAVRRAVAFIDEHADRDISAADIAAAAHVTIRAVQLAFRRYLDTTPSAYLRRVRLDHAHKELCAANPGDGVTVTEIAIRWGFASSSRFAARYRDTYGVPPSHTLRS